MVLEVSDLDGILAAQDSAGVDRVVLSPVVSSRITTWTRTRGYGVAVFRTPGSLGWSVLGPIVFSRSASSQCRTLSWQPTSCEL